VPPVQILLELCGVVVYVISEIDDHWSLHQVSPKAEIIYTNFAEESELREAALELARTGEPSRVVEIQKNGLIDTIVEYP